VGIRDVTGVFGRYFIVGFYVPTFFWLAYVKLLAGPALLPHEVESNDASAFAVVGIGALVLPLILQGLRGPIERLLSGYPLVAFGKSSRRLWIRAIGEFLRLVTRWKALREYERLSERTIPAGPRRPHESDESYRARRLAAYHLDRRFPGNRDIVLPTKFGNRVAAREDYARARWFLETVVITPHVESLLTPQEIDLRRDAETDVAFAVNACLLGVVASLVLGIDRAIETPSSLWFLAACLAPLATALLLYKLAVVAARHLGDVVRASIDLHRLDFYDKLQVRRPATQADDRVIGPAVNRMLLYGDVLPDEIRAGAVPARPGLPGFRITGIGLFGLGVVLARLLRAHISNSIR
jgi:hypothetical protein